MPKNKEPTGKSEYCLLCNLGIGDPDSSKIFIKNVDDIDRPDGAIDKS
ncbi:hypothetical protein NDI47_22755 [Microcoleus vaginatus GB1-A2]